MSAESSPTAAEAVFNDDARDGEGNGKGQEGTDTFDAAGVLTKAVGISLELMRLLVLKVEFCR